MMTYLPRAVARLAANSADRVRRQKAETPRREGEYNRVDLLGPPPGIEADVTGIQWRTMDRSDRRALLAELAWATADWGFDHYAISVPLDFYCGVYAMRRRPSPRCEGPDRCHRRRLFRSLRPGALPPPATRSGDQPFRLRRIAAISASSSLSLTRSASTVRTAWITVLWSRPPKRRPISG